MGGEISKSLGVVQKALLKPAIRSYIEWAGFNVHEDQLDGLMYLLSMEKGWDNYTDADWCERWPKLVDGIEKTVYHRVIRNTRDNADWTPQFDYWCEQYGSYSINHHRTCRAYIGLYMQTFCWEQALSEEIEMKKAEEARKERERWKKLTLLQKLKEKILRRSPSSS